MSHRFSPGQSVTFLASMFEASASSGRYTIKELLPAALGEYQYTVRREKTGELRRARETQLNLLPVVGSPPKPPTGQSPRRPKAHLGAGAAH